MDFDREYLLRYRDAIKFHDEFGPAFKIGFRIDGIEVTQAIQYYSALLHLTDPADRQPDNNVTLVANKPAWVRVHLSNGLLNTTLHGVTGTLEVQQMTIWPNIYSTVTTLAALPPGTASAAGRTVPYATWRGGLNFSLNFIIPAHQMCGALRLIARVNTPGGDAEEFTLDIDATLRQTLRVAGIMVGYNGPASSAPMAPNLTLAAPTMNDLRTTSAWTLNVFPVQTIAVYRNAGTVTWNRPLTDAPSCAGCCTPNWVALNAAVQAQRVADGNRTDFLYYGLMANGIPMGPVIGCNSGGVSTGGIGDGVTMAHELGHACGFPHAPCGTPGNPNYPAYEPYDPANTPQASIGEYGLDVNSGVILPPATFKDFMSYCGPRWISLFYYQSLINHAALDPIRTCNPWRPWIRNWEEYIPVWPDWEWLPDPPPFERVFPERMMNPAPVISIIGVVHGENDIEIQSVMRLNAVSEVNNGKSTNFNAQLIGENGSPVSRAPLYRVQSHAHGGCGCGCKDEGGEPAYPYVFQAFLADAEAGAALRISGGEREIWERKASDAPPRISGLEAYLTEENRERGMQLVLVCPVESRSEYGITRWFQWSEDGENWYALTTGVTEDKSLVDTAALPGGTILLRVLVSDGFFTTVSDVIRVELPQRPPDAAILAPSERTRLEAGSVIRLWASVSGLEDDGKSQEYVFWYIDGEQVASGLDAFVVAPQPGEHRLTLLVRTEMGEVRIDRRLFTYGQEER